MFVWILILGLFTWSDTQGIFKSLSWISQKEQKITGHEKSLRARSKLDCIVICRQFSHCVSVAYDVTVGTCYLHPSTVNTTAGDGMTVYINKGRGFSFKHALQKGTSMGLRKINFFKD